MTAPVLTRYPLDATATRRRRRRIAAVVAVRREQSVTRRPRGLVLQDRAAEFTHPR